MEGRLPAKPEQRVREPQPVTSPLLQPPEREAHPGGGGSASKSPQWLGRRSIPGGRDVPVDGELVQSISTEFWGEFSAAGVDDSSGTKISGRVCGVVTSGPFCPAFATDPLCIGKKADFLSRSQFLLLSNG